MLDLNVIKTVGFAFVFCSATLTPSVAAEFPTDQIDAYMQEASSEGYIGGVLISQGNKIRFQRQYGTLKPQGIREIDADTVTTIGSITKQFTAAAILKLADKQQLALTDTLAQYWPDVPADKANITIHQLLSHQAGFPGAIGGDRERIGRAAFVAEAFATPLLFPPGAGYEYSNVGFSLAAAIVEKVSGQSFESFLQQYLFAPANMHSTGYKLPDWNFDHFVHGRTAEGDDWGTVYAHSIADGGPGWHLLGNGGIHSTAADMFKWHQALNGNAILNAESKALLFGKHAHEGGESYYGYGWVSQPTPWGEVIMHNGGNPYYFADYLRFPEHDVMIFVWNVSQDRRMNHIAFPLAEIVFDQHKPDFPASLPPLDKPGSGPMPASDSLAAKWQLPGHPQGQRAAAMLHAIQSDDAETRADFVTTHFADRLIAKLGEQALQELLQRLAGDLGPFTLKGTRDPDGPEFHVVLNGLKGTTTLTLHMDADEDYRIFGVGVDVGD